MVTAKPTDWIREAVARRAATLGMTAYALAKATAGEVGEDQVRRFLSGTGSMSSAKLQHVFRVLGITLKVS